jgi:hypothetical protein
MVRTDVRLRIARVTMLCLVLGWGMAWGAVAVTYPDMIALPWIQIAVGAAIAAWGGATATLGRYLAATYDQKPFLWRPEVIRDGAVSVSVGSGAYMAGWAYELSAPMLGLTLLLAGYGGTRVLSAAAERFLSALAEKRSGT